LSGFLVGGKAIERFRDGTFRLGDYTIDRLSRIGVPFLPVLIFTVIVAQVTGMETANLGLFFGNLFFLQGISVEPYPSNEPLWSLSYEVWFYILAGACCFTRQNNSGFISRMLIIIAAFCVFTVLKPIYLLCWLLGALAWIRRPKKFGWFGLVTGLALAAYGMIGIQIYSEAQTANINQAVSRYSGYFVSSDTAQLLFCSGFALVIQQLILMQPKGQVMRQIEAYGTSLAAFSYTLYLIHNPILHILRWSGLSREKQFNTQSIIHFCGSILLCLLAAMLFYFLFEKRTQQVRRWLKKRFVNV
jgi:peptidoglycan/LPS O-acetylase OafA/YrhL